MGKKGTSIKKVIIGVSLFIGMILVATIIAVVVFFMSTPGKHSDHRRIRYLTAKNPPVLIASPDVKTFTNVNVKVSPEANALDTGLPKLTGSKFRDPFLPPAAAWPNLKTVVFDAVVDSSERQEQTISKVNPNPKPKTTPVKNHGSKNAIVIPSPVVSAPNPEQQDPNSPEFKETLILPGINQGTNKNTDIGLKINYKVKKGETLSAVSQKFGVPMGSIFKENHLSLATERLSEGKSLIIPIPKNHLYQLKVNETLWRIAIRYGTTVEIIQDINNLKDLSKLAPGQTIILPISANNVINKKY